jgi:hypothetical protein
MSVSYPPQTPQKRFIQLGNKFVNIQSITYTEIDEERGNVKIHFLGDLKPLEISGLSDEDMRNLLNFLMLESEVGLTLQSGIGLMNE